jgi:hypothetical protein
MSDLETPAPTADVDARADFILGKLGDDDAAPPVEVLESTPTQGEDGPAEAPVTEVVDEGKGDPASPVIDPPDSWTAEAKERFKQLPPDLQSVIAERDAEQKRTFNRQINEAAEQRKAAEAERQQAAQERQRYAQSLDQFVQAAQTLDPILAEGQKTDWVALARENPAEYVQKWATYQQRAAQVQAAVQQREQLMMQQRHEHFVREEAALIAKVPEWADPQKGNAGIQEIREGAISLYGYKPEEVQLIGDHRHALILRDALAYHKLLAAQKTAIEKKVVQVPRVQKPQAANETGRSEQVTARLKRARMSDSVEDRANAILAALD